MCIAANKVKGVRAALAVTELMACRARQHNDANILCLGAENDDSQLTQMIKAFLTCQFEGGRHGDRVNMMTAIENEK
jgi:ribose 5-phosphate isomerase B